MPRLLETGTVVLEIKRFLNVLNVLTLFYYLPLEKGVAHHLNKFEFPLLMDALCHVWFFEQT